MIIKTKKGMASLYLVAFTTLLLGILTMSFVRVMLTESKEAANSDLSQSAYDSALAGIEDAKTAIIMYNACRETGASGLSFSSRCPEIISLMQASFDAFKAGGDGSCDTVPRILGRIAANETPKNGEIPVGATDSEDNSILNQAYTCVTIANDSEDYLTILGESESSRTVPVRLEGDKYKNVVAFEVQWYSRTKDSNDSAIFNGTRDFMPKNSLLTNLYDNGNYKPFGNKEIATGSLPILAMEILQTDKKFQMYELDINNENNDGTDHALLVLYPDPKASRVNNNEGGFVTTSIDTRTVLDVSNKDSTKRDQSPQSVYCAYPDNDRDFSYSDYRCRATIQTPPTYWKGERAEHTFMIRLSLPYGAPEDTDVSVRACTAVSANGNCTAYADWVGIQFIVDSTGRASTLYRRVTARVNAINDVFIYPEYAVQTSGDNAAIDKNFWVSRNCWFTDSEGNSKNCANNGTADTNFPQEVPTTN